MLAAAKPSAAECRARACDCDTGITHAFTFQDGMGCGYLRWCGGLPTVPNQMKPSANSPMWTFLLADPHGTRAPAVDTRGCAGSRSAGRAPAELRAESGGDVGENLNVVGVVEGKREGERDLGDLPERRMSVQLFGDLGGRAEQIGRKHHPPGPLRARSARHSPLHVRLVLRALLASRMGRATA
jgi:hypothetical protein